MKRLTTVLAITTFLAFTGCCRQAPLVSYHGAYHPCDWIDVYLYPESSIHAFISSTESVGWFIHSLRGSYYFCDDDSSIAVVKWRPSRVYRKHYKNALDTLEIIDAKHAIIRGDEGAYPLTDTTLSQRREKYNEYCRRYYHINLFDTTKHDSLPYTQIGIGSRYDSRGNVIDSLFGPGGVPLLSINDIWNSQKLLFPSEIPDEVAALNLAKMVQNELFKYENDSLILYFMTVHFIYDRDEHHLKLGSVICNEAFDKRLPK